jgi:hypothetical protein
LTHAILDTQGGPHTVPTIDLDRVPLRFGDIHAGTAPLLVIGVVAGIVAVVLTRPKGRDALWALNAALIVGVAATFLWTREPRVLYEVPLVAAIGTGALVREILRPNRRPWVPPVVGLLVAIGLVITTVSGLAVLRRQRADFAVANTGIRDALLWVSETTPSGSTIAAPMLDSIPLGWWVEGLGERRALGEAPARWLVYPEERRLAASAERIFRALERDVGAGLASARERGADYLFIAKRTATYELLVVDLEAGRIEPVFENDMVVIFEVPADGKPT